ncbi:RES family NAD+ phosphorylase [Elongatibacter sediminis]|uniref:RES family NAD+ phosphorylase n=1 Tax=Elongatibacter sediminis TaxID=3119006 RepID=A0AAW9R5Z6_9GAMM
MTRAAARRFYEPPLASIDWKRSVRVVPSRFPPVGVFDRVADPADLDDVFAVEALTNDRLRDEAGDIRLVPLGERVSGPGTTPIMAAFTHPNREGSRFSDGSFGVYYAANDLDTALAESRYHRERFLAYSSEAPMRIGMRAYYARIRAELHDLRGLGAVHGWKSRAEDVFDPDPERYGAGQSLARELRSRGSGGLVYPSVRRPGGSCVGIFRPKLVAPVTQGPHFDFVWDGHTVTDVLKVQRYSGL